MHTTHEIKEKNVELSSDTLESRWHVKTHSVAPCTVPVLTLTVGGGNSAHDLLRFMFSVGDLLGGADLSAFGEDDYDGDDYM